MLWKYIEKIWWLKVFHSFLGMENKVMEIQITYFGDRAFDLACGWSRHTDHAGPFAELTLLGVLFAVSVYDCRHWNNAENRFYYDDEPKPAWIGHEGYTEQDYWNDLKKCAVKHHLDEDYLPRCEAFFGEELLRQEEMKKLFAKWDEKDKKPFVLKHPIDWEQVQYGKDGKDWQKCPVKKIGDDEIEVCCFRNRHVFSVESVVSRFDLYDKKGHLLSKVSDYEEEE